MGHFDSLPYERPTISEEEFVYDCLRNRPLFALLRDGTSVFVKSNTEDDADDDEGEDEGGGEKQ